MFYVAAKEGFLIILNTAKGPNKTHFITDIREAKPFATYEEADSAARSRIQGHYAILGISHIPLTTEKS